MIIYKQENECEANPSMQIIEEAIQNAKAEIPKSYIPFKDHNPQLTNKIFKVKRCQSYRYQNWDFLENDKLCMLRSPVRQLKLMSVSKAMKPQLCRIYMKKMKDINLIKLHNLSSPKIKAFSRHLGVFKNVQSFNYNHFLDYVKMGRGLKYIMKGLRTQRNIESLNLSLPFDSLKLQTFKSFTRVLQRLINLKKLTLTLQNLQQCDNADQILQTLPNSLLKLNKLNQFRIEPSFIPEFEDSYVQISQALQSLPNLRSVSAVLDSNPYSLSFFRSTKSLLKEATGLRDLTISITWSLTICENLQNLFSRLTTLNKLNIMITSYEETSCDWLSFSQAFRNLTQLKSLEMDLELCQELTCDIFRYLEQGLLKNVTLKNLKLLMNRHELGEDFTDELRSLLSSLPLLQSLEIFANRNRFINDESMERVGQGIYNLKQLKSLALHVDQCEGLSDRSLQLLRLAIQENTQFSSLNLSLAETGISDQGVKCLSKVFKYISNLHTLNLNLSVPNRVTLVSIASVVKSIIKHLYTCIEVRLDIEQLKYHEFNQVKQIMLKHMNPLTIELIGNDFSESTETYSFASGDVLQQQDLF